MGTCESKEDAVAKLQASEQAMQQAHEHELALMQQLDSRTRVPHLLVEIRSLGFVEIQGKNIGGIFDKLDSWLTRTWRVSRLEHDIVPQVGDDQDCGCCGYSARLAVGPMEDRNRLCDRSYIMGEMTPSGLPSGNGVYKARGDEGENNMGKLTMQLVSFMTNECGWTFHICDGGNLGRRGDIREQQIKFKAPHPLNLIAPHIMIELRQCGYIEINGPDTGGIHEKLSRWLTEGAWKCTRMKADPDYCDLKFSGRHFHSRGTEGENNMGMRTLEIVDFMVKECAWTMVTCNGGNYGRTGAKREQQLVFRNDDFVQHGLDHVLVELRTCGYVEVNGLHDAQDIVEPLDRFLQERWRCTVYKPRMWESSEKYCEMKYENSSLFHKDDSSAGLTNDLGKRTLELSEFFQRLGWRLLLCNGGSITPSPNNRPNHRIREQQLKFCRAKTKEMAEAPLLMIELRTLPEGWRPPRITGLIEVNGKNTNGIHGKLSHFLQENFGAGPPERQHGYCDILYRFGKFRQKECCLRPNGRWDGYMNGESNLGKWSMRLCDFMVDHLGEWDLVVCNSDSLDRNFAHRTKDNTEWYGVTAREMQLIFRHRPGGRGVFMSAAEAAPLGRAPLQPPAYWEEGCKLGLVGHKIVPGSAEELAWIQEILDVTFKAKATRDRHEELANRFVAVSCIRSEHPALWDRYATRRQEVHHTRRHMDPADFVVPKTMQVAAARARCCTRDGGNPSNQAYLLHGTHPTMAVAILNTSFTIDSAGKSVGTMFGAGVYLAESSAKADEYARHDEGGEYDGLYACLLCRAALGKAFVTERPGDFAQQVISGAHDHVLGDREKAVGTFREFVIFHESSIYPEYAIFYRREKDGKVIPPPATDVAPDQESMTI